MVGVATVASASTVSHRSDHGTTAWHDAPVRILHLVTRSQRRGAELVAVELARGLEALGHSNQVLALGLGFDGSEDADLPAADAARPTAACARCSLGAPGAAPRTSRVEPVDIVIAHGGRAVEAAVLVRRRGRPLIVWQRILGFPPQMWRPVRRTPLARGRAPHRRRRRAHPRSRRRAPRASASAGRSGRSRTSATRSRSSPSTATPRRATLRAELGIAGRRRARRLRRSPDRAEAPRPRARRAGRDARARRARRTSSSPATGRCAADFERDVAARGLDESVHVLGHRDDVAQILGAIDVFILTSDSEGLPGVLIEAQMAGCPIVTVPVGGVARPRRRRRDRRRHRARSTPSELAARVVGLLRDPELRRRLGERARRRAVRFSSSQAAAHLRRPARRARCAVRRPGH